MRLSIPSGSGEEGLEGREKRGSVREGWEEGGGRTGEICNGKPAVATLAILLSPQIRTFFYSPLLLRICGSGILDFRYANPLTIDMSLIR